MTGHTCRAPYNRNYVCGITRRQCQYGNDSLTNHSAYVPLIICNCIQGHYSDRRICEMMTLNEIHYNPEILSLNMFFLISKYHLCTQKVLYFSHYAVHGGFFETDGQVLNEVYRIRHIPCTIVQGRYDVICPPKTAWLLRKVIV
jgi:hypothetical protein